MISVTNPPSDMQKNMLTLPAIEYSFFTYNVEKQGIFDLYTRDHMRQKLSSHVP